IPATTFNLVTNMVFITPCVSATILAEQASTNMSGERQVVAMSNLWACRSGPQPVNFLLLLRQADLRPCRVCVGKAGRDPCEDLIARLTSRIVVLQEPPEAVLDRLRLALLAELPHRRVGIGCQLPALRHRTLDRGLHMIHVLLGGYHHAHTVIGRAALG